MTIVNQVSGAKTQTVTGTVQEKAVQQASRLYFVDNLRTLMTVLVVLHHIALVYGATAPFYYSEPPFTNPTAFLGFGAFTLVNQAWFMGAFFLLAGYFTPTSFDRKGAGKFLQSRLLRLGIPTLVFAFVLSPISNIGLFLMPPELTGIASPLTWETFWKVYPDFIHVGPLWFAVMLLVFCMGYAAWRGLSKNRKAVTHSEVSAPGYLGILAFVLVLTGLSYAFRMVVPLGKSVWQFPTLAYLPQYLTFFVVGIVASRRDWLRTLPKSMGIVGLVIALIMALMFFGLAFNLEMLSVELADALEKIFGNGTWQSAVYALWDSIFSVGLFLGLVVLFRTYFNGEAKFGKFLARQNFGVYVLHVPVVVFLTYALRELPVNAFVKFGLAPLVIVPTCYLVAYLIRKLPYVSRVL